MFSKVIICALLASGVFCAALPVSTEKLALRTEDGPLAYWAPAEKQNRAVDGPLTYWASEVSDAPAKKKNRAIDGPLTYWASEVSDAPAEKQ